MSSKPAGTEPGPPAAGAVLAPVWWFLADCLECGMGEVPFRDAGTRARWVGVHQEGTGHEEVKLWEE